MNLTRGAWVEHAPGWLDGHSGLFEALRDSTAWRSQRRQMYEREVAVPRLTASVPDDGPGHPVLHTIVALLERRYGARLSAVSMALYRDGHDSVAMHGDRVLRDSFGESLVATVSVGERRRFLMKPADGGPSIAFTLGWGDLIVMGGTCQRTWRHGVPKVARAGPRLSIMFRRPRQRVRR